MKKLTSLILVTLMILSLTGCGNKEKDPLLNESKEDLVYNIHSLENQYASSITRIGELEEMLKGIQGEDVKVSGITEFSDGTGRLTLNSNDSIIKLPKPFTYPKSTQYFNNSSVNLTDGISIKPSSNWDIVLSGTQVNLYHSNSKISGLIVIGGFERNEREKPKVDELSNYINEFFEDMPPEIIQTSRIFVNDTWSGINVKTPTFVDEKEAQIRCGYFAYGDINITYWFNYDGEADASKDELILTLMQTMSIHKNNLRIE